MTKPYKSYVFKTHDPVIDELRTVVQASGLKISQIADCGVSATTIRNWFKHRTRRPQFATISAVALSCGCVGIRFGEHGRPELTVPIRRKLKVISASGKKRVA